jgi:hypothetical protein
MERLKKSRKAEEPLSQESLQQAKPAEQNPTEIENSPKAEVPSELHYEAADDGLYVMNPDGTGRHLASDAEQAEIANAMAGGTSEAGRSNYKLRMLDEKGLSTSETAPRTPTAGPDTATSTSIDSAENRAVDTEAERQRIERERLQNLHRTLNHVAPLVGAVHAAEQTPQPAPSTLAASEAPAAAANNASGLSGNINVPLGVIDPHHILSGEQRNTDERNSHYRDANSNWSIDERQYLDIKAKPWQEVIANERDAQFFGELIHAIAPHKGDVLARIKEGQPSRDDLTFMTYASYEYAKWMRKGENIAAHVKPSEVELFIRRNPDMRNLTSAVGQGRGVEIGRELILHLAMKNPAVIEEMEDAFKSLDKDRNTYRYKRIMQERDKQSRRLGFDPEQWTTRFDLRNGARRKETEVELTKHIHEKAGNTRRAIDWIEHKTHLTIPGSSRNKAILEIMWAEKVAPIHKSVLSPRSWVLSRMDKSIEILAEQLGEMAADPDVRRMYAREALENQKKKLGIESGPKTFKDMQTIESKPENSEQELEKRITNFIQQDPDWKTRTVEDQNRRLEAFRDDEEERTGAEEGTGFWAWLFRVVFGQRFNDAASKVTKRPVHTT